MGEIATDEGFRMVSGQWTEISDFKHQWILKMENPYLAQAVQSGILNFKVADLFNFDITCL